MSQVVRWGILGTGRIADRLLKNIQASSVATAVSVAGRSAEKTTALAQKHGVPRVAEDFEALVADPEVEVVYNTTPNHLHRPWTLRALDLGKHVLCEKPLALDADEAREMFAAARQNDRVLMEAFAFRCHPQTETIRELVSGGELGELSVVRAVFGFHFQEPENVRWFPEMGGGALYDIGCYCINMTRWIVGAEPQRVTAFASLTERGVDTTTAAVMEFGGGVLAMIDCSFRTAFRVGVEVGGTQARLVIPNPWKPVAETPLQLWRNGHVVEFPVSSEDTYQLQVDHFSRCVRGQEQPRVSAEDSIHNMEVIDEIRRQTGSC